VLFASRCVGAAWELAASLGVTTVPHFRLGGIAEGGSGAAGGAAGGEGEHLLLTPELSGVGSEGGGDAQLQSSAAFALPDRTVRAKKLILAPGAWLSEAAQRFFGLQVMLLLLLRYFPLVLKFYIYGVLTWIN